MHFYFVLHCKISSCWSVWQGWSRVQAGDVRLPSLQLCILICIPLCFFDTLNQPPPQCLFPIYAFYANSTEGNDAVRAHFIGVLMISLFFGSLCAAMRRAGSARVLRSTPVSCASSPPASETRVRAAPPVFPRRSSKRRVFAPMEGGVSSATRVGPVKLHV